MATDPAGTLGVAGRGARRVASMLALCRAWIRTSRLVTRIPPASLSCTGGLADWRRAHIRPQEPQAHERCACRFCCLRPRGPADDLCDVCQPCSAVAGNHGCTCQSSECDGRRCSGLRRTAQQDARTPILASAVHRTVRPPTSAVAAAPQAANARRGASRRTQADVHATSAELGLSAPLEPDLGPWKAMPSEREASEANRLLAEHRHLVRTANKGDQRLGTALVYLRLFTDRFPSRKLFHSLDGPHPHAAARHNSETKGMLAAFIRERGAIKKGSEGAPLKHATVAGYVSAIATECTVAGGYAPTDEKTDVGVARAGRTMRRQDGKLGKGTRKLRRGIRAQHLKTAAAKGIDRFSKLGARRWARATVAHNLYLRGGEAGIEGSGGIEDFAPHQGHMTPASVTWFTAAEAGQPRPSVRLLVMPIKDRNDSLPAVPQFIMRRNGPEVAPGADPVCAYDALAIMWRFDVNHLTAEQILETPLFQSDTDGQPANTDTLRADARAIGALAGLQQADLGGTSFRIGGAEDTYDVLGLAGEAIIRERGRWHSDIHQLYQRCSASLHMHVSVQIGESSGVSLEALGNGWANPGRR